MQFDKAYAFLIQKLERDLPKYLTYHNASHTEDVVKNAGQLGKAENVPEHELTILKTAALFHDAGFLETYKSHEEISCRMAEKWLPQFHYSNSEIEEVCSLVTSTKAQPPPGNKLARILWDANLYYLGTESYIDKANKLYKELHEAGMVKDRDQWEEYRNQIFTNSQIFHANCNNRLKRNA